MDSLHPAARLMMSLYDDKISENLWDKVAVKVLEGIDNKSHILN
jgi:hypothetical protein